MGFLGALTGKKKDPFELLKEQADASPGEPRLLHEVATKAHGKGLHGAALEYARRAAQAHVQQGFTQRAVAELRAARTWGEPTPELLEELSALYLELGHKEDAREVLLALRRMVRGDAAKVTELEARIEALGPGR